MPGDVRPEVVRNEHHGRFELVDAPDRAYLEFGRGDDRLILRHTQVADEFEGQGVGSALVRSALAHAEADGLTIVPVCRFVAGWLDHHPDRAAELDISPP